MSLCIIDTSKLENCSIGIDSDCTILDGKLQPVVVCPKCGSVSVMVIDSRRTDVIIKRRRRCMNCDHRYTAYEISAQDYKMVMRLKKFLAEGGKNK